jgi:hypothetical protein
LLLKKGDNPYEMICDRFSEKGDRFFMTGKICLREIQLIKTALVNEGMISQR